MPRRELRADILLTRNIRALLDRRGINDKDLAVWCGHDGPWLSKIMKNQRGIQLQDLGKIADFFGLTVSQLFQPGISALTERRRHNRRTGIERRSHQDRRDPRRHLNVLLPPEYKMLPASVADAMSYDEGQAPIHGEVRSHDGPDPSRPAPFGSRPTLSAADLFAQLATVTELLSRIAENLGRQATGTRGQEPEDAGSD